jgi:hypothetical protein
MGDGCEVAHLCSHMSGHAVHVGIKHLFRAVRGKRGRGPRFIQCCALGSDVNLQIMMKCELTTDAKWIAEVGDGRSRGKALGYIEC